MQKGSNVLSQAAIRVERPTGFLLILNVLLVFFSLTNLQAQTKESATPPRDFSPSVEILTPTGDVDFRDYVAHLCGKVKRNWFAVMPESAQLGDKGRVVVRFQIQKDGTLLVKEPMIEASSKKGPLDKAAISAIRSSAPFQHLPEPFRGPYIELRFIFLYNLPLESPAVPDAREPSPTNSHTTIPEGQPPFDKLELFGFLAAAPYDSYASQVIQTRGTSFTPDAAFVASVPAPAYQKILKNIRPRAAETISPDRRAAYELLRKAWDAKENRRMEAASENYQKALQLAPNSATVHLAYALNLLFLRNYPAAEAQARQSLRLWPEYADAHASLALSLTAQKQFSEAELESREALRIFPEQRFAMLALGTSLTHEGKYTEAIPVLQKLIAASPKMPEPRKFLGICLFETGEINEGANQLNLYVMNTPEDAEGHYYLGAAFRSSGRSAEASSQFAEAFRLQPNNPQYEAAAHPDATRGAMDADSVAKPEDGSISGNIYANRFFGFTYEFPTDWLSQGSDAVRSAREVGVTLFSTDDPTEIDIQKAAERNGHPLLYVAEGKAGNKPILMKFVMVKAFDVKAAPELTPDSFLKSLSKRFEQTRVRMVVNEAPKEIAIAGRTFWKATFAGQTAMGSLYASYFVTADKGYLLMFVVGGGQDPLSLHAIEKSLDSVHFLGGTD
jgi:TonB family protein